MLDRSPRRSVSNFRDRVGGGSVNMVVLLKMPSDYHCNHCHLRFSTGWFHHDGPCDGAPYYASTLLVCSECGTQHSMDHAETQMEKIALSQECEYALLDIPPQFPDRLTCNPCPIHASTNEELQSVEYDLDRRILVTSASLRPVRILPSTCPGLRDTLALSTVECGYCGSIRALVKEWNETIHKHCPSCKEPLDTRFHDSLWWT